MKRSKRVISKLIVIVGICFLLPSCSVQKRMYRPGIYIETAQSNFQKRQSASSQTVLLKAEANVQALNVQHIGRFTLSEKNSLAIKELTDNSIASSTLTDTTKVLDKTAEPKETIVYNLSSDGNISPISGKKIVSNNHFIPPKKRKTNNSDVDMAALTVMLTVVGLLILVVIIAVVSFLDNGGIWGLFGSRGIGC
jgi:hypothetical protein